MDCKKFLDDQNVNFNTLKPPLSGQPQDLPKCPLIRGCLLSNKGL